jgi:ankyrin repeat protein
MKQRFNIINILIKHGSNVNDVNASGWNCLISAVNYFHEEASILLLILLQVKSYFYLKIFLVFKHLTLKALRRLNISLKVKLK